MDELLTVGYEIRQSVNEYGATHVWFDSQEEYSNSTFARTAPSMLGGTHTWFGTPERVTERNYEKENEEKEKENVEFVPHRIDTPMDEVYAANLEELILEDATLVGETISVLEVDKFPLEIIMVWGLDLFLVAGVWELLHKRIRMPKVLTQQILSVTRVCQKRDGKIRFELLCRAKSCGMIITALNRHASVLQIWCKLKNNKWTPVPYEEVPRFARLDPLKICSYNINGVTLKLESFRDYIDESSFDIIALQETLRTVRQWRINVPGYNTVERSSTGVAGQRGLAVVVKHGLNVFPIGTQSPYFIFLRVFGKGLSQPWIFGTVYIPHRHVDTSVEVKAAVRREIETLRRAYPQDAVVVTGDYNMSGSVMSTFHQSLPNLTRVRYLGQQRTFRKDRATHDAGNAEGAGALDHILIDREHEALVLQPHVDTSLSLSDHWPVVASIALKERVREIASIPKRKWKFGFRPSRDVVQSFVSHNYWDALIDDSEDPLNPEDIDDIADQFLSVSRKVGEEVGLYATCKPKRACTSSEHQVQARLQRQRYVEMKHAKTRSEEEYLVARISYLNQRRVTMKAAKMARRKRWDKSVRAAIISYKQDIRGFWRWVSTTGGWKRKDTSASLQPIVNNRGKLCTSGPDIDEAWTEYYAGLASDISGHSRNEAHWKTIIPGDVRLEDQLRFLSLNSDILLEEVAQVLHRLLNNKAPGPDQVPIDMFKMWLEEEKELNTAGNGQHSNGLILVTKIIQAMWKGCHIPPCWRTALIISLHKKGDPTSRVNYRGISLMDSMLKILLKLLTFRITNLAEANSLISIGQSGFRESEEAVGQAIAAYDIIARRQIMGKCTYGLFLDFEKAYDVVPHCALFRRLELYGFHGRMLEFIKHLYASSKVSVRSGDGAPGAPFALLRGLRQGCPMSPILFNLFIEPILKEHQDKGVPIPGIVPETKVLSLLFADDMLALVPDQHTLALVVTAVCDWADKHDMKFGVGKCGIMHFPGNWLGDPHATASIVAPSPGFEIRGIPIPIVDSYVYLGLKFTTNLSTSSMIDELRTKGTRTIYGMEPFLRCTTIPLSIKRTCLLMVVLPTLLYGAELWGMQKSNTDKMQTQLNVALRWCLGVRGPSSLFPVQAMYAECQVDPICVYAAKQRARAYFKYGGAKTWIGQLVRNPLRARQRSWVTSVEFWLNKYTVIKVGASRNPNEGDAYTLMPLKEQRAAVQTVYEATQLREHNRECAVPLNDKYFSNQYSSMLVNFWLPQCGRGIMLLSQLRADAYWVGQRLRHFKTMERRSNRCQYCRKYAPETRTHLLLECTAWNVQRETFLGVAIVTATNLLTSWGTFDAPTKLEFLSTLLLGGCVRIRGDEDHPELGMVGMTMWSKPVIPLQHGMPEKRQRELLEKTTMLRVAKFLEAVDRKRVAENRTAQVALGLSESLDPTGYD